MSEMCVNILRFISCTHNMNKSSSGRFLILLVITLDPQWYEGRLLSNAHSEISRKRDHVFKQTKVGSKEQYFSYKLTYFNFRHNRLVVQYIFPNIKQVYACRQWRTQEFFIWSTTSQLASLHHLRWKEPLEIPLEVGKEMEIAWHQVRPVGRMGENLELQRLQSINHCASNVWSCIVMQQQNRRCWQPNSTHPPP